MPQRIVRIGDGDKILSDLLRTVPLRQIEHDRRQFVCEWVDLKRDLLNVSRVWVHSRIPYARLTSVLHALRTHLTTALSKRGLR
jgi:hypothetical protein